MHARTLNPFPKQTHTRRGEKKSPLTQHPGNDGQTKGSHDERRCRGLQVFTLARTRRNCTTDDVGKKKKKKKRRDLSFSKPLKHPRVAPNRHSTPFSAAMPQCNATSTRSVRETKRGFRDHEPAARSSPFRLRCRLCSFLEESTSGL